MGTGHDPANEPGHCVSVSVFQVDLAMPVNQTQSHLVQQCGEMGRARVAGFGELIAVMIYCHTRAETRE